MSKVDTATLYLVRSRTNGDVFVGTPEDFSDVVKFHVLLKGANNGAHTEVPTMISFHKDAAGIISSDFYTLEMLEDVSGDKLAVDIEKAPADVAGANTDFKPEGTTAGGVQV